MKWIMGRPGFNIIFFTIVEKSWTVLKQIQKFEKENLKKTEQ